MRNKKSFTCAIVQVFSVVMLSVGWGMMYLEEFKIGKTFTERTPFFALTAGIVLAYVYVSIEEKHKQNKPWAK